jgi:hypothetical protein
VNFPHQLTDLPMIVETAAATSQEFPQRPRRIIRRVVGRLCIVSAAFAFLRSLLEFATVRSHGCG